MLQNPARERRSCSKSSKRERRRYSKSSKRERGVTQIPAREREGVTQNPARERMSYSKSSKREKGVVQNPAREREGVVQNPARERKELFKIQQEREAGSILLIGAMAATTKRISPSRRRSPAARTGNTRGRTRKANQILATAQNTPLEATQDVEEEVQGVQEFSFVVANARFLLDEEEHLAEVLRERRRFFKEQGKKRDFWVVPEPAFLSEMPEVTAKLARPAAAVVSTDHEWITYVTSSLSLSLSLSLSRARARALFVTIHMHSINQPHVHTLRADTF